jgi:drug/metabolite transporter (DMT)-like permease
VTGRDRPRAAPLVTRGPRGATVAAGIAVAIAAISTSPILVRVAELPALALAFWRCLAGAVLLAPFALRQVRSPAGRQASPRTTPAPSRTPPATLLAAGVLLAVHFALFNASLSFTSVASSATLVSCSPLFVGLGGGLLGEAPSRRAWLGIALAIAGAALIGLADAGSGGVRGACCPPAGPALLGDVLAFAGAAAMAGYLLLGRLARRRLAVSTYSASVYGVAAAVLLPACLLTGAGLGGYPARSWLAVAGVVAGPQLLGHTVFNGLLGTVSATVVAVAILAEPVGATALAWLLFGEPPGAGFWLGAPLVLGGIWLVMRGQRAGLGTTPVAS